MKNLKSNKSDIFIMSKGHGSIIQYLILNELGFISDSEIDEFCLNGSQLGTHPDYETNGINASTGSLGHGLGIAVGQAYAELQKKSGVLVYCLISDGELQEGSTWEAIMMASNLKLSNLVLFIDLNDFGGLEKMSEAFKSFYPLDSKLTSFGWEIFQVDGHNQNMICQAFQKRRLNVPSAIICRTIKGKGISFMENVPIWHYRSPTQSEFQLALNELGI